MGEISTRVFRLRDGVAIELPEALGFPPGTEVVVTREGDGITVRPVRDAKSRNAELARRLREIGPPSEPMVREPIDWPERPTS